MGDLGKGKNICWGRFQGGHAQLCRPGSSPRMLSVDWNLGSAVTSLWANSLTKRGICQMGQGLDLEGTMEMKLDFRWEGPCTQSDERPLHWPVTRTLYCLSTGGSLLDLCGVMGK